MTIGASPPRLDAGDKATGRARYADDIVRPGMLYAALLTSPHAHAKILAYRTDPARAIPGVKAIVTGADLDGPRYGGIIKDEAMVARGKVRYVGEIVAAVAAIDAETASRAAAAIEVDYEPLPAVLSIDAALAPDAPLLHEEFAAYLKAVPGGGSGNVLFESTIVEGDVERAFGECDVVVEGTYETQAQHHVYIEPNGCVAEVDAEGRITIFASCQSVHHLQQRVAEELGEPMARVRAIATRVGGAFGGKHASNIHSIAAWLARAARRPVKLVLSRMQDFEVQRSRHPARIWMKTGARHDGTILARDVRIVIDGGAYADESPPVLAFALLMSRGPYRIPNVRAAGSAVYTSKLRAGSFRGFGNPQASFAGESQIDELAARLEINPVALRLKNAMRPHDTAFGGQPVASCIVGECLARVRDAQASAAPLPARPGRQRGVGFAAMSHVSGLMGTAANVQLRTDGSIALSTGCVDIGQGADTVMVQICADAFQVSIERVSYARQDSDSSPYNWKTAGSRSTYMTGRAVAVAAVELRDRMFEHAGEMLECAAADLELRPGGAIGIKGVPQTVKFKEIAMRSLFRSGGPLAASHGFVFDGPGFDPKRASIHQLAFANLGVYTFGAHCVEVDVDEGTGGVEVRRAWCAHDVGRAINPVSCEGQIQGGFVQGIGYALTEAMRWNDEGWLTTITLADYKVPGLLDVPTEIHAIVLEDADPSHPVGAKGVGEISLVGAAPAIANAICNATGARAHALPMTPERVLAALDARP
ncbi:MAG: xanthine dehydrogenase family protein molybdopterin-binding subunit [Betaproteobacteria bacterium]